MGRGAGTAPRADVENAGLTKEINQLKVRNQELNELNMKVRRLSDDSSLLASHCLRWCSCKWRRPHRQRP